MNIGELQVCLVEVPLGESDYNRPCVVAAMIDAGNICLAAISSKLDLYNPGQHFLIPQDHPDFPATGLKVTSYVIGAPLFDGSADRVVKVLGLLSGDLAEQFKNWIG